MDQTEFEQYIDQYGGVILSFCHYLTKNNDEAEDLCQDYYVQGFRSRNNILESEHVKPFLLSIAIRLWQNRKRKFAWRKRISESKWISLYDNVTKACIPSEQTLLKDKDSMVREAVERLDEKKRIVVLLYYGQLSDQRKSPYYSSLVVNVDLFVFYLIDIHPVTLKIKGQLSGTLIVCLTSVNSLSGAWTGKAADAAVDVFDKFASAYFPWYEKKTQ